MERACRRCDALDFFYFAQQFSSLFKKKKSNCIQFRLAIKAKLEILALIKKRFAYVAQAQLSVHHIEAF